LLVGCGQHSAAPSTAAPSESNPSEAASTPSPSEAATSQTAKSAETAEASLAVFAGIPPLAYLIEQIGGDRVNVGVLLQSNQDPHTFDPTPQQMVALSRAKVFFTVGMPFESVLANRIKTTHAQLVVVDTTDGIVKRDIEAGCNHEAAGSHAEMQEGQAEHEEELEHAGHDHSAGHDDASCVGMDPHVWLSPPLLKRMAGNVNAALAKIDAASAAFYAENLDALSVRIDDIHQRITEKLRPYRGQAFYVFHPGFGYFADAYGLRQIAVEAGGRSPSPKQMQSLIRQARQEHIRVVFVQPQSPQQSAKVIADAVGAKVVTINGLAKDVLADTEDIAAKIELALSSQSTRLRS
jgi:zinc transport system substrate-binding protein